MLVVLFLLLVKANHSYAQTDNIDEEDIKQTIENTTSQSDNTDFDYNTVLEELKEFAKKPINLNKTDAQELADLGLLTQVQIDNLLLYIEKYGKLISIYELQAIPNLDIPSIKKILPFIKVNNELDDVHVKTKDLMKN